MKSSKWNLHVVAPILAMAPLVAALMYGLASIHSRESLSLETSIAGTDGFFKRVNPAFNAVLDWSA